MDAPLTAPGRPTLPARPIRVMGYSHEFVPVPEHHHGVFRFTPQAAAAVEARRRKSRVGASESDAGPTTLRACASGSA